MGRAFRAVPFVVAVAAAGCSSSGNEQTFGPERSRTDGDGGNAASGSFGGSGAPGDASTACVPDKNSFEVPGDGCDNDGDGTVDNASPCDGAATGPSPEDFARAIGVCDQADKRGFGLVSAKFTRGFKRTDAPMPEQHGTLTKFGDVLKPREGNRLGVLSTGYASEYNGKPGAPFGGAGNTGVRWFPLIRFGEGTGTAPPGFPKAAAGCKQASAVNDVATLHLELKAPKNAAGIKFDFNFHSGEWPAFICSSFNDGFVAYLQAKGFNGGVADNISFDSKNNPVSVNNSFFDRCTDGAKIGCYGDAPSTSRCPAGPAELAGTGFGVSGTYCDSGKTVAGGATGWLTSQAPVNPGETFTLDLMIWDTGDNSLDSLVLLDNFQWVAGNVVTQTERPAPR